tara:strand:+ start:338 stop:841 length:504 start_codon:yes stop_codon:yes gene_type:complete
MKIIISGFGTDESGIVKKISKAITDLQGNIEESRMIKLGTEFTIMMLIDIYTSPNQLKDKLDLIKGMQFIIKESAESSKDICNATISLTGADNIGIVNLISDVLAKNKINILEMNTDIVNVPNTGTPIFNMIAKIQIIDITDIKNIETQLNKKSSDFDVEINLSMEN